MNEKKIKQIDRIIWRCTCLMKHGNERQALVNATRLWNWIDHNSEYEQFWWNMVDCLPWAFADECPNNIYFAYND